MDEGDVGKLSVFDIARFLRKMYQQDIMVNDKVITKSRGLQGTVKYRGVVKGIPNEVVGVKLASSSKNAGMNRI
jgi:hypothetical protein